MAATFFANPNDDNEPWIENPALEGYGFRNWHLMFFCFSGLLAVFILICCCVKIRIPRTKQEIEGDYRRKKLAEKFQERLRLIQNQNNLMDSMDLQEALRIIQEDFDNENRKINEKIALGALPESNTVLQDNSAGFARDRFSKECETQPPIVIAKTVITNILLSSKVNS